MNRDQAAEKFLRATIADALNATTKSISDEIIQEPTNYKSTLQMAELRRLYAEMDEKQRSLILFLIRETAISTLFSVLVLLDQTTASSEGTNLDFPIYVSQLQPNDPTGQKEPETSIRINPRENVMGLHDIFLNMLE